MVKRSYMIKCFIDSHTTPTFVNKLNLANSQNLKVIPFMYDKIDILDYDAAVELLDSIYENEKTDTGMSANLMSSEKIIPGAVYMSKINSKCFCINTFD